LERAKWICLGGQWWFAIDAEAEWSLPHQVQWQTNILVPFAPETSASGIHNQAFFRSCWYQRKFETPEIKDGERLFLHFGAVDYSATVWVNGSVVVRHEGGYTPFYADITDVLVNQGPQTIVVRAEDDPHDLGKPRGKQDWQLRPHSIWYPRTTGIWQQVWMECIPSTFIRWIRWTPNLERWEIGVEVQVAGPIEEGLQLTVRLQAIETVLAEDSYLVLSEDVQRRIALSDPGIDDFRNEFLWSPTSPTIIRALLQLRNAEGQLVDSVASYTALRSIGIQGDRFILNGRPYPLRFVLDQGYWPNTGLTPPSGAALRKDIELAKAMGFNGVRKHQKIEDPRFLYWADMLGLLVWEEMPSAYRFTRRSVARLTREWHDVIDRDASHPCIVAWVPFNESWGVPDLPDSPAQRHYVQALYHLTKTLDPTRPVIGNDGWESVATDIIGIHDYEDAPELLMRRYGRDEAAAKLFQRERPAGRLLVLDEQGHRGRPIMLTEFGGIAFAPEGLGNWGYSRAKDEEDFKQRYIRLLGVVNALPILSGFCYTQFTDTYQETNGLLYADRTPKIPIQEIARATRSYSNARTLQGESEWRERLMEDQFFQDQTHPE